MLALLMSLRFSNAYKQNEKLSSRLIEMDKLKDDFLTRTAHEFKTPLHGMIHIAQSMMTDERHPATACQREKLELISDIAGRLSRLVYDILDLSRLTRGEMKVECAPLDVRSASEVIVKVLLGSPDPLIIKNGIFGTTTISGTLFGK